MGDDFGRGEGARGGGEEEVEGLGGGFGAKKREITCCFGLPIANERSRLSGGVAMGTVVVMAGRKGGGSYETRACEQSSFNFTQRTYYRTI